MLFDSLNESLDKYFKDDDFDEPLEESLMMELKPKFDGRQSFYGKATVEIDGDDKTLFSYNTPVCRIADGKPKLLPRWNESPTALRHVREFLKQNGFEVGTAREMLKLYEALNDSNDDYVVDFLNKHDNESDYRNNHDLFLGVYSILYNHGDIGDSFEKLYSGCTDKEKDDIKSAIKKFKA